MVIVAIWASVALVIGLYVLFVVWRLRVDRRKKAMQSDADTATSVSSVIARAASSVPATDVAPAAAPPVTSSPSSPPSTPSAHVTTVAEALAGIALPHGLAPLTTMAWRDGVVDRVAFWTSVPAEVVGPAFGDELERLGYTVSPLDDHTLAAQRADARLVAIIHPDGHRAMIGQARAFESVPELATVIEIWIPLV